MARVHRRQAQRVRALGERHGLETAFGVAVDLLRADLRVEEVRDLARDDAVRVRPRPLLEVPVVVGPGGREREFPITRAQLQALAGEARKERRKVQGRIHPREVHVLDAVMSHDPRRMSSNRCGSNPPLVDRTSDDGVEADVRDLLAVVHPDVCTVAVDDLGCPVGELGRQATLEGVRFDDVVVDRDDGKGRCALSGSGRNVTLPLTLVVKSVFCIRSSRLASCTLLECLGVDEFGCATYATADESGLGSVSRERRGGCGSACGPHRPSRRPRRARRAPSASRHGCASR